MKKYLIGATVLLLFAVGCGSDDNTPLTQGDPSDPEFQMLAGQFEGIDQTTQLMAEMVFDTIDGITATQAGTSPAAGEFNQVTEWDETSGKWNSTLSYEDPQEGLTFAATSSIQFIQGGSPIQYPESFESLDEVRSNLSMQMAGAGISNAAFTQDLVITAPDELGNITLDGSSRHELDASFSDETTSCTMGADFNGTINGVRFNPSAEGCPTAGSIRYSGRMTASCTGDGEFSTDRTWSVRQDFSPEELTMEFISGGTVWTVTEPCF